VTRHPGRLSKALRQQLERINCDRVVVAAVLTITRDIVDQYSELGVAFEEGRVTTSDPSPPPRSCGLYARRNLDGWKEKRTDLAKEKREISHWAPSWNSGNSHLVSWEVEAYPIDYHPAKVLTISATVLEHLVDGALVRFRVDEPLDKCSETFAEKLMFNLRLLREATGEAQVFDADLTDDEFARIQQVDWELLPRGSADKVLARLAGRSRVDPVRLKVASERLRVLDRLEHTGFIIGKGRFARYFGAKFGDRLVALENLEYGNALYVFEDNWDKLTQLSRTELIRRRDPSVHRLPHLPGWQSAIRKLIRGNDRFAPS
jgi:hypothetical protein